MIPILFEATETQFNTNGIGRLSDAISCQVEENLNGLYELTMVYPITGQHYAAIEENRIILAEPFEGGDWQPFMIYRISRPLNGIVTINAEHISYLLNKIIIMPYSAGSCTQALSFLPNYAANDCPFTFWSDISGATRGYVVRQPGGLRAALGGSEGSVLDTFGGEYEFDNWEVKLHSHRGTDNNVRITYGKNLTGLRASVNIGSTITGVMAYYQGDPMSGPPVMPVPGFVLMTTYSTPLRESIFLKAPWWENTSEGSEFPVITVKKPSI